jgi:hypothetical protein
MVSGPMLLSGTRKAGGVSLAAGGGVYGYPKVHGHGSTNGSGLDLRTHKHGQSNVSGSGSGHFQSNSVASFNYANASGTQLNASRSRLNVQESPIPSSTSHTSLDKPLPPPVVDGADIAAKEHRRSSADKPLPASALTLSVPVVQPSPSRARLFNNLPTVLDTQFLDQRTDDEHMTPNTNTDSVPRYPNVLAQNTPSRPNKDLPPQPQFQSSTTSNINTYTFPPRQPQPPPSKADPLSPKKIQFPLYTRPFNALPTLDTSPDPALSPPMQPSTVPPKGASSSPKKSQFPLFKRISLTGSKSPPRLSPEHSPPVIRASLDQLPSPERQASQQLNAALSPKGRISLDNPVVTRGSMEQQGNKVCTFCSILWLGFYAMFYITSLDILLFPFISIFNLRMGASYDYT